ncbi:bifunctional YncE family protein/alkaline phosphatase family protein [Deinococcus sp.]|uniref:bifunctional YncE family protein/alkaline phosphatase family protein n=1 Tax=Deinococcus sp. TaxID=47478 RepID=UPI0025B8DB7D|nr:bifunctional YncE family protein/alkaline phosphatase family protein [Deinococcus sp.]
MKTQQKQRTAAAVALLTVGAALAVGTQMRFFSLIGPQPDGTGITPNHWTLTPHGQSVEIGDRPMGASWHPGGRYLAVSNDGQGVQTLALYDSFTRKVAQSIPYNSPEALYMGVVWSPDGNTLYASAGGNNKVRVYTFDAKQGRLTEGPSIILADAKTPSYPAGLAISPDGKTLFAALNLGNSVAAIDLSSDPASPAVKSVKLGEPAAAADIGVLPVQMVMSKDGKALYASLWNGHAVSVIDTAALTEKARVKVGDHPSGLTLSPDGQTLYVANANSDTVSAVDTAKNAVRGEVKLAPYAGAPFGSMPDSVSVTPDGKTLLVANAGNNDVALVNTTDLKVRGLVPTAWFPSVVTTGSDGRFVFVANMKGLGAGPNPDDRQPTQPRPNEQYIANMARGSLQTFELPGDEALKTLTAQVVKNNGFNEMQGVLTRGAKDTQAHAIPRRVGDPTPLKHVIYIIKENRTYDQVLGAVAGGDGDKNLVLFGEDVTPNLHAVARTFGLFDHFYADAEVSADGHNWTMGGVATEYTQKSWPANYSGRNRPYDFEGSSSAPAPTAGYLFDFAKRAGISYRSYGEFADFATKAPNIKPAPFAPALEGHLSPTFPSYDLSIPDQVRFDAWKKEFDGYAKGGNLPQLSVVRFPSDHTSGTRKGTPTPQAYVADNDLAVGKLIDAVSHSPYWKDTVIFSVEDDAQNGPDHIDAHRTTAYVASAYSKRGSVDHTQYSTVSMLRTLELILGLPPMTQFDASATPMIGAFQDKPDLTPYTFKTPKQPLDQMNALGANGQEQSARMDFSQEDRADDHTFSEIVWHAVKGKDVPMPTPHTTFHESASASLGLSQDADDAAPATVGQAPAKKDND